MLVGVKNGANVGEVESQHTAEVHIPPHCFPCNSNLTSLYCPAFPSATLASTHHLQSKRLYQNMREHVDCTGGKADPGACSSRLPGSGHHSGRWDTTPAAGLCTIRRPLPYSSQRGKLSPPMTWKNKATFAGQRSQGLMTHAGCAVPLAQWLVLEP